MNKWQFIELFSTIVFAFIDNFNWNRHRQRFELTLLVIVARWFQRNWLSNFLFGGKIKYVYPFGWQSTRITTRSNSHAVQFSLHHLALCSPTHYFIIGQTCLMGDFVPAIHYRIWKQHLTVYAFGSTWFLPQWLNLPLMAMAPLASYGNGSTCLLWQRFHLPLMAMIIIIAIRSKWSHCHKRQVESLP